MDKRGITKIGITLILIVIGILLVNNIFAETPEEEKQQLEAELQNLNQQLIDLGYNMHDNSIIKYYQTLRFVPKELNEVII